MKYVLHLSRDVPGFGKPGVASYPAPAINGHLDENGELVVPHRAEVRAALPSRYRKAFDRDGGCFWYDKNNPEAACHLTLRDYRGKYLNQIHAFPVKS